jgi:hypothetical protein
VQLAPPGSQASIIFGKAITSAGGADVSEVFDDAGGVFHHGDTDARVPGAADGHADYGSFASFSDPDGNGWMLQEIDKRLPGHVTGATFESPAEQTGEELPDVRRHEHHGNERVTQTA